MSDGEGFPVLKAGDQTKVFPDLKAGDVVKIHSDAYPEDLDEVDIGQEVLIHRAEDSIFSLALVEFVDAAATGPNDAGARVAHIEEGAITLEVTHSPNTASDL